MSQLERTTGQQPVWKQAAALTGGFVVLLWVIEFVDHLMNNRLDGGGVEPREADGLLGILFAPVLHAGWDHLISNTVPTLVLGFLVLASGISRGLGATAIIWVVGGIGTWLIGPSNSVHIGASVLVFGWLVFLVLRGFFNKRAWEIGLGVILFVLYGSLLWGVLPGQPGVSWQGHLFGAIGGGLAAWVLRGGPERRI